jgi:hypothetical protein
MRKKNFPVARKSSYRRCWVCVLVETPDARPAHPSIQLKEEEEEEDIYDLSKSKRNKQFRGNKLSENSVYYYVR